MGSLLSLNFVIDSTDIEVVSGLESCVCNAAKLSRNCQHNLTLEKSPASEGWPFFPFWLPVSLRYKDFFVNGISVWLIFLALGMQQMLCRSSSEVACTWNQRFYPHARKDTWAVGGIFLPRRIHGCCLVLVTCFFNWELRTGNDTTPGQDYSNSVPDQHYLYLVGQHYFVLYTKCMTPVG